MSDFRLRDVREVWDTVLPLLVEIKENTGAEWRPEDVYAACMSGGADLFIADSGTFCVLQSIRNDYSLESEVVVWIAYNSDPIGMAPYLEQIKRLAKSAGAVRLRMFSPREGWKRIPDWTPGCTEYRLEL